MVGCGGGCCGAWGERAAPAGVGRSSAGPKSGHLQTAVRGPPAELALCE